MHSRIDCFVSLLRFRTTVVDVRGFAASVPSDPGDDFVLATLLAGNADWLVSGDQDLLAMAEAHPILSPTAFVDRVV